MEPVEALRDICVQLICRVVANIITVVVVALTVLSDASLHSAHVLLDLQQYHQMANVGRQQVIHVHKGSVAVNMAGVELARHIAEVDVYHLMEHAVAVQQVRELPVPTELVEAVMDISVHQVLVALSTTIVVRPPPFAVLDVRKHLDHVLKLVERDKMTRNALT